MEQKQTEQQARNADSFEMWLKEHLPHITMKDKSEYRSERNAISFICEKHGEYIAQPISVKRSQYGCLRCGRTPQTLPYEDFVSQAKQVHGDKYVYLSEQEAGYISRSQKIKIYCPQCDIYFEPTGANHLRGQECPSCAGNYTPSYEEFVNAAKIIHGDKYIYLNEKDSEYKNKYNAIKIQCPIHGIFSQRAKTHLEGGGCKQCGREAVGRDNLTVFARDREHAESACILYYIKIYDSYKIGITKNLMRRFKNIPFELIYERYLTREQAWAIEHNILREFAQYQQYNHKLTTGNTECFSIDISQLENFNEIFNETIIERKGEK